LALAGDASAQPRGARTDNGGRADACYNEGAPMADDDKLVNVMEKGFATLAELIGETNARLDATNAAVRENGRRIDALTDEVRTNGSRLDNLVSIAGRESRALRKDVDELKARVEALEKKAS
jgi:hypothetical protein